MTRALQVLWLIVVTYASRQEKRGDRLRVGLERLGGAWLKFGQLASTRYDLLPEYICDALRSLQGRIPVAKSPFARECVIRELGSMDAFATFNDTPLAAATVGQVHKATLRTGRTVVVKVLRPGVREQYVADLRLLRRLARIVDRFRPDLSMPDMVTELADVLSEEVDLRFEADHLHTMRPVLRKHGIRAPKVYRSLCTEFVLVCRWIDGVTMSDVLARTDLHEWLGTQRTTGKQLARKLISSLHRQIFEGNRFHGDLHPGNMMMDVRGRTHFIDFGSTSSTDAEFLGTFRLYMRALAHGNYSRAADCYCLLCIWPKASPVSKFVLGGVGHAAVRRDLSRIMRAWAARARVAALPFAAKSIHRLSVEMMDVIMRAGGAMQWSWLRLTRAFSTIEPTLGRLWPEVNYIAEMDRYLRESARREKLIPLTFTAAMNIIVRLLDRLDEMARWESAALRFEGLTDWA